MDLLKQEELAKYIQKEINQYKKPENKNEVFKEQLMQKAFEKPSHCWAIYAPTQKMKYEFMLVENKLKAHKWLKEFQNKNESIQSISQICYEACLIRDGKSHNKLDKFMLDTWKTVFETISTDFLNELDNVINKWNEWEKKSMEERQEAITKVVELNFSNKSKM